MFILSSIFSGLEFWSVNLTSIYETYELKVFKNNLFYVEISSNCPSDLSGTNLCKTQNLVDNLHTHFHRFHLYLS